MSDDLRLAPEVLKPLEEGLILPVSGETEPLVLAHGNSFCATNERGDLAPAGARDLGYFHEDTRHLSHYELWIAGGPPVVLSSETTGAATSQIDLTLTDCDFGGQALDPHNFLHVQRKQLVEDALIEQLTLTSFLRRPSTSGSSSASRPTSPTSSRCAGGVANAAADCCRPRSPVIAWCSGMPASTVRRILRCAACDRLPRACPHRRRGTSSACSPKPRR